MRRKIHRVSCSFCGISNHGAYECVENKRYLMNINPEGNNKYRKQWLVTKRTWIRKNPPPIGKKYWRCYLQISKDCKKVIDLKTLTLDHVKSISKHKELRFRLDNLRPACLPCNMLKGSQDLEAVLPLKNR